MAGNPLIAAGQQLAGQNINVWLTSLQSANAPSAAGTELLLLEQSGRSRKFSLAALLAWLSPFIQTIYAPTVITAASYQALATDSFIGVNYAGAATITLPNTSIGLRITVADCSGAAGTNLITINPLGGGRTIDGASSYVLAFNYQSTTFQYVPALRLWKSI